MDNVIRGAFGTSGGPPTVPNGSASGATVQPPPAGGTLTYPPAPHMQAQVARIMSQLQQAGAAIADPTLEPSFVVQLSERVIELQGRAHAMLKRLDADTIEDQGLLSVQKDISTLGSETSALLQSLGIPQSVLQGLGANGYGGSRIWWWIAGYFLVAGGAYWWWKSSKKSGRKGLKGAGSALPAP